jgi:hypothetical protein
MKRIKKFLTALVERRIAAEVEQRIATSTNLTSITQFSDEDIFIAAYPKSGNTWFQNLITGIYFGVDPELAPDTLIQELVPDVHFKNYYRRFLTPMFFKTHFLPRPEYKRVVYLVRDGRDVMVSYYYYLVAIGNTEVDFMAMVRSGDLFPSRWHEHVQAWQANPYNAEKIIIKYEDLKRDPLTELTRFCEFAGIQREQIFLQRIVDQTAFVKMQAKEKEGRMFRANQAWPQNKSFFRRGVVGSFRDEMPSDVLEVFLQDAGTTLRGLGYA